MARSWASPFANNLLHDPQRISRIFYFFTGCAPACYLPGTHRPGGQGAAGASRWTGVTPPGQWGGSNPPRLLRLSSLVDRVVVLDNNRARAAVAAISAGILADRGAAGRAIFAGQATGCRRGGCGCAVRGATATARSIARAVAPAIAANTRIGAIRGGHAAGTGFPGGRGSARRHSRIAADAGPSPWAWSG